MVNEPSFVLDNKKGGMNWGFCAIEKKGLPKQFFAVMATSSLEHSETTYNIFDY